MPKFNVGDSVQIKHDQQLAGYIGIIIKYYEENHTYLVRLGHDQELLLHETAIEIKKA